MDNVFLEIYPPDQPNLASLAICLAPGKKGPDREKDLGRPLRRGFKGKERTEMAWVHLTGLPQLLLPAGPFFLVRCDSVTLSKIFDPLRG